MSLILSGGPGSGCLLESFKERANDMNSCHPTFEPAGGGQVGP